MGFFVPFAMCAAFLIGWFFLCKWFLRLYTSSVIRALLRSPSLNRKNTVALLSVYFGAKSLFRGRWFPMRSSDGTVYREVPCILVMGRKIFVLEICPYPGVITNTSGTDWHIDPPAEYRRKEELWVPNPVLLAKERAQMLEELFGVLKLPFEITVESMAILTDKRYQLVNSANEGLYELSDAIDHLFGFGAKTKTEKKKMKREREVVFAVLKHFSLSRSRAVARNDRMRLKKK